MDETKKGAPLWMVSFGDMMTLILTFFILLVSLGSEQQGGLIAQGLGSFLVNRETFGLPGLMDREERITVFNNVRRRFQLPPEEDPERAVAAREASSLELLSADAVEALRAAGTARAPGQAF